MKTMLLSEIVSRLTNALGKKTYNELLRATQDPLAHNTAFLLEHLKENRDTEFGRKYNFKDIDSIEKYKAAVPLLTYDDFSVYIDRMKKDEFNLLTKEIPMFYAQTSGSIGNPKLIPVMGKTTNIIFKNYLTSRYRTAHLYKIAKTGYGRTLFVISYVDIKTLPNGIKTGDIAGFSLLRLRRFWKMYTTPACSVFANEFHDFYYVHARFALIERNLTCITSAYMTETYELIKYIIAHQDMLLNDIEKGIINDDVKLPDHIRSELKTLVKPDAARAKELRQILKSGDYKGILKKIWPKLLLINAIGSASFQPYTERVMEYTGDEVAFFHLVYAASEGHMGTATDVNSMKYSLLPHKMFYEFIPEEEMNKPNPETLTIDQLESGKEYEIVLTNLSGFYRYRINDVVKVVGFLNKTPQVCFSYRRNQLINMASEKTTNAQLESAVNECAKHFGCHFTEFAVYPDLRCGKGHYTLLLETDNRELKHNAEKVAEVMHQKLLEANPEIEFIQNEGMLGATEVLFVQPQTFALYKDLQVFRGASRNQVKPVRIIDTPEKENFFFALLDKE
jgi:hypothetical protein